MNQLTENTDTHKRCPVCCEVKPLSAFGPAKDQPHGVFGYCRQCNAAKALEYRRASASKALSADDVKRFWSKVDRSEDCWEWQGKLNKKGYGAFLYGGRTRRAHRVAYEIATGQTVPNLLVCHKCDNPCCVRPDHLFLGTHEDNMKDMTQKGRSASDENNPASVLTWEKVREIRQRFAAGGVTKVDLGREYGVSKTNIRFIINNEIWKERAA